MKFKSLQINGFKSFPDKVKLSFNEGITSIVGPNGSGKSNIVDATRWVLGEQSSKTLRGGKMEDVIFAGTSQRRPMALAEVAITLENDDNSLPSEFYEVTVTRRLYRSGESEYLLNGKSVRLKDINELFMNTGLGKDGYSLIGQGKIADVLSVKGEERRNIFEEAAGISKYRYRRVETERNLRDTEENLVRLQDKLDSLTERVEPLKKQSEKARLYLDYMSERKQLEIDVWLDSIDRTKDAVSKAEADLAAANAQVERTSAELSKTEEESDALFLQVGRLGTAIEDVIRLERELENEAASVRSNVAVFENDISHHMEQIVNTEKSLQGAGERISSFDEREAALLENKAVLKSQIEIIKSEIDEIRAQIEGTDVSESDKKSLMKREEILQIADKVTDLRLAITSLESASDAATQNEYRLQNEIKQLSDKLKGDRASTKELEDIIAKATDIIKSNENIISGYDRKLGVRNARLSEYSEKVQSISIKEAQSRQKLHLLSEMEKNMEGFWESVKSVITEKNRGRLKGVVGTVASLIKTDEEHSLAIETALGGALQNVVVEDDSAAKACINFLKSSRAGRATFLPLTTIKGNVITDNLRNERGFVGIASELAICDARYKSVVNSLLGRTVVMENLERASELAKKNSYRFRIVTLDGQVINAGGSFTGGSQAKSTGALSRKNEIETLKSELIKIEGDLTAAREEVTKSQREISEITAQLDGANAQYRNAVEDNIKAESELSVMKNAMASDVESESAKNEELKALIEKKAQDIKKLAELRAEQAKSESEQTALEEEYRKFEEEAKIENAKLDSLMSEVETKKFDVKSMEGEISLIERQIEDSDNARKLYFAENDDKLKSIELLKAEIEAVKAKIELEKEKESSVKEKTAELREQQAKLKSERGEADKRKNELHSLQREISSNREALIKESARLEGIRENIHKDHDNIMAKLWEEYELTYSTAAQIRSAEVNISQANARISELRTKIKGLGSVNVEAIEEYKSVKEDYEFYTVQVGDMQKSKGELEQAIKELTNMMKDIFKTQFAIINEKFKTVFIDLFGGGSANLELADPNDVLGSSIDIKVAPPGKLINNLSSLSGGEQALVAIAMYFAILSTRPSPFVILDEIDTALDEINVARLANYYKKYTEKTQLILITHRRGSMEASDVLYGVTMQEKGVSKILTINVNEVEDKIKLKVT